MHDQADQLRALVRAAGSRDAGPVCAAPQKLIVCGGKGGVGATTIAVNLSVALARLGARVVLVDADMNRADVAALCQLDARHTVADVLSGRRTVHEVLHRGPAGIQVLPGLWSATGVPDCSPAAQDRLLGELDRLGRHADQVVLDVGSGLNHVVRRFWQVADRALLLTTPDRIAVMDAYAAIKVLTAGRNDLPVELIVNQADAGHAAEVYQRINQACARFLNREISLAGPIAPDVDIPQAAMAGRPFVLDGGGRHAAGDLETIAERLLAAARFPRTSPNAVPVASVAAAA
jgi:flagellar biosynthesis protein FlhG